MGTGACAAPPATHQLSCAACHCIKDGLRAGRTSRQVKIHRYRLSAAHCGYGIALNMPPVMVQAPMAITYFNRHLLIKPHQGGRHLHGHGAGHDQVGLTRGTAEPDRSGRNRSENPKVHGSVTAGVPEKGQRLLMTQLCRSSRLVRMTFSLRSLVTVGAPIGPQLASRRSRTAAMEDVFSDMTSSTQGRLCARRRPSHQQDGDEDQASMKANKPRRLNATPRDKGTRSPHRSDEDQREHVADIELNQAPPMGSMPIHR